MQEQDNIECRFRKRRFPFDICKLNESVSVMCTVYTSCNRLLSNSENRRDKQRAFANEYDILKSFPKPTKDSTFFVSSPLIESIAYELLFTCCLFKPKTINFKKKKTWISVDNKSICIHLNDEIRKFTQSVKNGRKIGSKNRQLNLCQ